MSIGNYGRDNVTTRSDNRYGYATGRHANIPHAFRKSKGDGGRSKYKIDINLDRGEIMKGMRPIETRATQYKEIH